MGKFNTYRYLVLEDAEDIRKSSKRRHRPAGRCRKLFLLLTSICFILFIGLNTTLLHPIIEYFGAKLGITDTIYTVIIETDNIRTELYVYKFHKYLYRNNFCLDEETITRYKSDLSSNAYDSNKGEELYSLLKQACSKIVFEKSVITPLIFKLSLVSSNLPVLNYYQINDAIKNYYDYISSVKSPFFMKQEYFGVLKKQEKILDTWVAVNYLLNNGHNLLVLDLDDEFLHYITNVNGRESQNYTTSRLGPDGRVPIFMKSFPNLGLMEARLGVMQLENPLDTPYFNSSCINPIVKNQLWSYGTKEYYINGPPNPEYIRINGSPILVSKQEPIVNTLKCMELITRYVNKNIDTSGLPNLSADENLYFFGHFFTHAADLGLIDAMNGGKLSIATLSKIQASECHFPNVDQPWLCFDLIYIYVLLKKMFGREVSYQLVNKINGHQISWALGASYKVLDNLMQYEL